MEKYSSHPDSLFDGRECSPATHNTFEFEPTYRPSRFAFRSQNPQNNQRPQVGNLEQKQQQNTSRAKNGNDESYNSQRRSSLSGGKRVTMREADMEDDVIEVQMTNEVDLGPPAFSHSHPPPTFFHQSQSFIPQYPPPPGPHSHPQPHPRSHMRHPAPDTFASPPSHLFNNGGPPPHSSVSINRPMIAQAPFENYYNGNGDRDTFMERWRNLNGRRFSSMDVDRDVELGNRRMRQGGAWGGDTSGREEMTKRWVENDEGEIVPMFDFENGKVVRVGSQRNSAGSITRGRGENVSGVDERWRREVSEGMGMVMGVGAGSFKFDDIKINDEVRDEKRAASDAMDTSHTPAPIQQSHLSTELEFEQRDREDIVSILIDDDDDVQQIRGKDVELSPPPAEKVNGGGENEGNQTTTHSSMYGHSERHFQVTMTEKDANQNSNIDINRNEKNVEIMEGAASVPILGREQGHQEYEEQGTGRDATREASILMGDGNPYNTDDLQNCPVSSLTSAKTNDKLSTPTTTICAPTTTTTEDSAHPLSNDISLHLQPQMLQSSSPQVHPQLSSQNRENGLQTQPHSQSQTTGSRHGHAHAQTRVAGSGQLSQMEIDAIYNAGIQAGMRFAREGQGQQAGFVNANDHVEDWDRKQRQQMSHPTQSPYPPYVPPPSAGHPRMYPGTTTPHRSQAQHQRSINWPATTASASSAITTVTSSHQPSPSPYASAPTVSTAHTSPSPELPFNNRRPIPPLNSTRRILRNHAHHAGGRMSRSHLADDDAYVPDDRKPLPPPHPTKKQQKAQGGKKGLNSFFLYKKDLVAMGFVEQNKEFLLTPNGQVDQAKVIQLAAKLWDRADSDVRAKYTTLAKNQAKAIEEQGMAEGSGRGNGFGEDVINRLKLGNQSANAYLRNRVMSTENGKEETNGSTVKRGGRKRGRPSDSNEDMEYRPRKKAAVTPAEPAPPSFPLEYPFPQDMFFPPLQSMPGTDSDVSTFLGSQFSSNLTNYTSTTVASGMSVPPLDLPQDLKDKDWATFMGTLDAEVGVNPEITMESLDVHTRREGSLLYDA